MRGRYSPKDPVAYGAPAACPNPNPGSAPVLSAVAGSNADLLREVARLWITSADVLIDVTGGNGGFWRRTAVQPIRSDIEPRPGVHLLADCRRLPYATGSVDVAVFDPPYQPLHGHADRTWGVGDSYALPGSRLQTVNDVLALYRAGIAECGRVLRPATGRLLVKCQDMTYNHRLHLMHLDVLRFMVAAGLDLADQFILFNQTRMPQETPWQERARRAHSTLLVGIKTAASAARAVPESWRRDPAARAAALAVAARRRPPTLFDLEGERT